MTKQFQRKFTFPLPIYGYTVYVVVTMNMEKSLKKERFEGHFDATTSAMHFPVKGEAISYVFLPLTCSVNDMAHEGMHVAQSIIDWIGATYKDREFVAYLVGYIIDGLYSYREEAKKFINCA